MMYKNKPSKPPLPPPAIKPEQHIVWKNINSKRVYTVWTMEALDANNPTKANRLMVVYADNLTSKPYVLEKAEFLAKYTPVIN